MSDSVEFVSALVLRRQLEALPRLGVDDAVVRAMVGPLPAEPDVLVSVSHYQAFWPAVQALYGKPGLPSALAMAIPFGAMGVLDYLVGSAHSVESIFECVKLHLTMVALGVRLRHQALEDGSHLVEFHGLAGMSPEALEFTLAIAIHRLRYVTTTWASPTPTPTQPTFRPVAVGLPSERPAGGSVHAGFWACDVRYGQSVASCVIDAANWAMPVSSADPYLHLTLQRMAPLLQLAPAPVAGLEEALRARLRDALAQGHADANRLACLLGLSKRTLQRRLQAIGSSFSRVVEDFRQDEAKRLLNDKRVPLVQIASKLGYAEQTSFTRAFRRWTGKTPGVWRGERLRREVAGREG